MASASDTLRSLALDSGRAARLARVGIFHDDIFPEAQDYLSKIFSPLRVKVISISSFRSEEQSNENEKFDIIGLIGSPKEFLFLRACRLEGSVVLAFAPKCKFNLSSSYLKVADAVVFCETRSKDWLSDVSEVVYHLLESLILPSLLNIDVADVRNIARGIGIAFNESDDNSENIISRLPRACLVARSALLHFSCKEEVKLREVYSISKTIAQKQGTELSSKEIELNDANKLIRRLNVKMGIRVRDTRRNGEVSAGGSMPKRISMTAILFGI